MTMKTRGAIQTVIGAPLVVDDLDTRAPQADQVLLRLTSTGICHSQLHRMRDPQGDRPLILGHEATGRVVGVGEDVAHVKEGDLAIVTWVPRNRVRGRPTHLSYGLSSGGQTVNHLAVYTWAQDVLARANYVVPIPDDSPTDSSSIVGCAVLTGAGAVLNTAKVRPGESVAIFGVGGVGLSAVQMASILGADPIVVVDLDDQKLDFARKFGATHAVNAGRVDPVQTIVDLSGGGVEYAFDAIGVQATVAQVVEAVRGGGPGADNRGGTAVLIGQPVKGAAIDPGLLLFHQRRVVGSLGATYPDKDFAMFLRWAREGKFPLDKLVTRRYTLDQINRAYEELEAGEILGRAIIEF